MKLSKLINIAWVFFALVLTTTTVLGQGWGNRNRANYDQNENCLPRISGLTEKQQTQILKMEDEHQEGMVALREKRRSTVNAVEKSEIRTEMLKKVEAHRLAVRGVLTEDQQKQYDQLHAYGNNGGNQNFRNSRGNFVGYGNGGRNYARNYNRRASYNTNNFRGRGGNFQQGQGRFAGNRANYGRGMGRYNSLDSCRHGSQSIDTCGFRVIEETDEKF